MHEFRIDGPALDDGVPIHVAVAALDNFQAVVDKTYLVLFGAKRMSAKDREIFQLKVKDFERGSLLTHFEIALSGVQLTLPFISSLGPQNLWDYTRDAFSFLTNVCGAVQKDEKPTYQFLNDGNVNVQIGETNHHYHAPVIQIGELALPSYQNLAHLIEPAKLSHISAKPSKQKEPDLYIGPNDRGMFDIPRRIEKETRLINCELYDFNKYKHAGRLSVKQSGQAVPEGDYTFEIFGPQDHVDYIYSMLKPQVRLFCLVEMESNPFGEDKVHKLHVTGINP